MRFIYVKGSLLDLFGREKAYGLTSRNKELGVGKFVQLAQDELHTFVEVIDESNKFIEGFEKITLEEANKVLDREFIPNYVIKNDALMSANINQLVTSGELDLSTFDGVWDEQHELKELYETYNVSGIYKSEKPVLS